MTSLRTLTAVALLAAAPARSAEKLAVIAVGDPPNGPDADLSELTHQLRAACRDRVGGVLDVPTMRAKLLGQLSNATLAELDRAYGGALAVYQNGEFESSIRTLRAIVDDLEGLPESEDGYVQWRRALLRLAHASSTIGLERETDAALVKILRVDPAFRPDPDQYSPAYRRRMDDLRAKVKALPRRKLVVTAEGKAGAVFVNGRPMGRTPLTLELPAGQYRVGGAAGALHVPSFAVDLEAEDRAVALDFALADSLRVNAGPGLALGVQARAYGIIRAGAWLGADKLVVAQRVVEGEAQFLLGGLYDVRRGALLREGSVRMVAGTVPSLNLGALAAFLLTGQGSREVEHRSETPREIPLAWPSRRLEEAPQPAPAAAPPAPTATPVLAVANAKVSAPTPNLSVPASVLASQPLPTPGAHERPPRRWTRTAFWASGGLALALTGLAAQQALAASSARDDANALVAPNGALRNLADRGRYDDLQTRADASARNAVVSAGAAVVFAAAAGVLGWWEWGRDPGPAALAFRF